MQDNNTKIDIVIHNILIAFEALCTLSLIAILVFTLFNSDTKNDVKNIYSPMHYFNDGWTLLNDDKADNISLPSKISTDSDDIKIQHEIDVTKFDTNTIKFNNKRMGVKVYADNDLIYQINSTDLSNNIPMIYDCIVKLPSKVEPYTLTISFFKYKNGECTLPSIKIGTQNAVFKEVAKTEFFTIINIAILIFISIAIGISLLVFKKKLKYSDRRWFCMLFFLIAAAVWLFTDSAIGPLLNMNLQSLAILSYFSFWFMPIPIVFFIYFTCEKKYQVLKILILIGFAVVILQTIFCFSQRVKLNHSIIISHIYIITSCLLGNICIIDQKKEKKNLFALSYLQHGLTVLYITAILSILSFWLFKQDAYYRIFVSFGVMIFYFILCLIVVYSFIDAYNLNKFKAAELMMYERLSLEDSLTGLKNRRAFEKHIDELQKTLSKEKNAVLIMIDLNGLKYTNDSYGHSSGDELIIAAAHCIQTAFPHFSEHFRIGGDEFAIVMLDTDSNLDIYTNRLLKSIEDYNAESKRSKLSIAFGLSYLNSSSGERKTVNSWKQEADIAMYMNKASVKHSENANISEEMQNMVNCIIATVEAKDSYTANHSKRVEEISELIAIKMGLSPKTVNEIKIAAQLHDVGKLGIPDLILSKPSGLTENEYKTIKMHPIIGEKIVSKVNSFYDISLIVRHHHEHYDGSGYPDGISGKDIPLSARVIAVADSIDAITSLRVYSGEMDMNFCKSEIEKNLGTMYDPAIGKIAIENWEEISQLIEKHRLCI